MSTQTFDPSPNTTPPSFAIQGYAALGDGRSVALVAPDGAVAWWCVPNIDSEPLFDTLLDPKEGGSFALHPTTPFRAERRYLRDSNVLSTIFTTDEGSVRVTESINSTLACRLPWCEFARRIEVLAGTVTMRARIVFGTRGGTVSPWLQANSNGCVFHVGPVLGVVRATPNMQAVEEDHAIEMTATLGAGERALVAIVAGEDQPLGVPSTEDVDRRIDLTDEAWRNWAERLRYDGPHREVVRRSALALKLLLFSPTGAIAAAATTSLPERVGGDKNWDYRYAWVRDAAYTLIAFLRLGVLPESQAAFQWLVRRLGETGAKVCYRLDGGPVPAVRHLDPRPVVAGNAAAAQHQHGIYGDILQAAWTFVAAGNVLDQRSAAVLSTLVDECAERWRTKDAGMWELPEPRHYTMSKISCWQALTRAVDLAEQGHLPSTCVPRWSRERDRVAAWINANCWSREKAAYTFYAGTERLDASLALAAAFGFASTGRLSSTVDAIRDELGVAPGRAGRRPWIHRYSGAKDEEGAFLACTFWLVEAYAELGRRDEAATLFEDAVRALPAGVGVLAEMVDVDTGDFVGNLPQGLSHLALIHAAVSLDASGSRMIHPKDQNGAAPTS